MKFSELVQPESLAAMIEQGYVYQRPHPTEDLTLYCYTKAAQFDWLWNATTKACRGIIVDDEDNIVARPFEKFGSLEQHLGWGGKEPTGNFRAFEKVDGSMLTLYRLPSTGELAFATKGSFESDQALAATEWLHEELRTACDENTDSAIFDTFRYTYVWEWVSPENRVVVDYGERREAVLLDVLEIDTGYSVPREVDLLWMIGWATAQEVDLSAVSTSDVPDDEEGYVLRYRDARIKVKGERYLELHRLKFNLTPRRIVEEYRKEGLQWVDELPDEFYDEVMLVIADYERIRGNLQDRTNKIYGMVMGKERKEAAQILNKLYKDVAGFVFSMMDGKVAKATDKIGDRAQEILLDRYKTTMKEGN